jgi:molecular chaperone DnaK
MREDVAASRPANIIGIYLGTTNTVVARFNEGGEAETTNNDEGKPITPSVILVEDSGSVVIGSEAKKFLGTGTPGIFVEFKREMGTDKSWPAGGRNVTPIELSALLLKKVVGDYAEQFGQPQSVVITWPANYRNEQREATKDAAKRAGLNVEYFIEEPTAAALYYATDTSLDGKYLVYDFGGGTFDVTLIEAQGNSIEVLYQDGVQQLGGKDLDNALLKIVGEKFRAKTGDEFDAVDCNFDKLALESNKHTLSNRPSVSIRLVSAKYGPMAIDVTRDEFEAGITHLIDQAEMACENVLRCGKDDPSHHVKKSDIKEIFMVGGISRVPAMQASVERLFGKKPKLKNPEQAIALGAAIYAAHKAGKEILNATQLASLRDFKVNPVAPHFIGTSAMDPDGSGVFNDTVIAKGTPLPCKVERTYYTTTHNQAVVNVDVTQSAIEERALDFVAKLWEGSLKLPRGCPAGYPIKVTFSCDINGTISVDVVTGGDQEGPGVTAKLIRPGPTPLEQ